ncbi:MAG: Ig-like domain-containing protein [Planctomycetes bacterium]|nr:Ig-like domain-containing protein [Planctomycetota bacterium]
MRVVNTGPVAVVAVLWLAAVGLTVAGCGGGGGSDDDGVGGPFRVVTADALPNGPLMPADPNPPDENQYIRIEFSRGVDPASLFDPTTENGASSALRLIAYYYEGSYTPATPPDATSGHSARRLEGFLVWNGQTNFDLATGTFRPVGNLTPISLAELGISAANYQAATHVVYFIADKDRNPLTPDSFLPSELAAAGLQASQILVDCQTSLRSLRGGDNLAARYGASFNVGTRDYIFPRVDSVDPARDQQNVDVNSQIVVRFIEPIDASTAAAAPIGGPTAQTNFLVEALVIGPGGPAPVQIDGSLTPASGLTFDVVFTPRFAMPGNTVIKVTIRSGTGNYLDLANNELAQSDLTGGNYTFTTGAGPQVANNPVPPQVVHLITQNSEVAAIDTNEYDDQLGQYEDFYVPVNEKGSIKFPYVGNLLDLKIGPFIAPYFRVPGSGANVIGNPPVQNQYLQIGLLQGNAPRPIQSPPPDIHIWTPPGTAPDNGLCNVLVQPFPPPVQPVGNFLFVSNEEKDVIHVINSNTYQHYSDLRTPDPRGLAVDPLLSLLFVSNFGANSVSVVDLSPDPNTSLPNGWIVTTIPTGEGPDAITVVPTAEDVIVVNRLENSASVIQLSLINSAKPVRVKLTGNIGPTCVDVCATGRIPQLPPFWPNLPYYAYFANLGGDSVAVFEGGPQQLNGYGRDNIIEVVTGFPSPTSVNTDQMSAATATAHEPIPTGTSLTGCWVTCGDGTVRHLRATRFKYTNFPNPPPAYIGVEYEVTTTIKVGDRPRDVVIRDPFVVCQTNNNHGAPDLVASGAARRPARMYVANGDGSVSVVNLQIGREVLRLPAIGVRKMSAYYTN